MKIKPGYIYILIDDEGETWSYNVLDDIILMDKHDGDGQYNIDGTLRSKYGVWKKTEWKNADELNEWIKFKNERTKEIQHIMQYSRKRYEKLDIDKALNKFKMLRELQK
jgi:hypothetical protein